MEMKLMMKNAGRIVLAAVMAATLATQAVAAGENGAEPAQQHEQAGKPTRYSQRYLIEALKKRGYYFQFRDVLQNTEGGVYWDLFVVSDYLSSDDQFFTEMMPRLQQALEISGDLLSEILAECEIAE